MANDPLTRTLGQFRRLECVRFAGALSDAELLHRFTTGADEAAFEALTWRHGPMVLAVCGRVLRHAHDAEDAFQATFLVLFKKARSIRKGQSLAGWLHRVALRVALRARARAARREAGRQPLADIPALSSADGAVDELGPVLDEEINRLPERHRTALVLCCLQGRSYEQAARELGCPLGTLQSRLARARQQLQQRLTARGITVPAALLATGVGGAAVAADVSPTLVGATLQAAAVVASGMTGAAGLSPEAIALARAALRSMTLARLRGLAVALGVVALLLGGGWAWQSAPASSPAPPVAIVLPPEPPPPPLVPLAVLQGHWGIEAADRDGESLGWPKGAALTVKHDRFLLETGEGCTVRGWLRGDPRRDASACELEVAEIRLPVGATQLPRGFEFFQTAHDRGGAVLGLYASEKDRLRLSLASGPGQPRPANLESGLTTRWVRCVRITIGP